MARDKRMYGLGSEFCPPEPYSDGHLQNKYGRVPPGIEQKSGDCQLSPGKQQHINGRLPYTMGGVIRNASTSIPIRSRSNDLSVSSGYFQPSSDRIQAVYTGRYGPSFEVGYSPLPEPGSYISGWMIVSSESRKSYPCDTPFTFAKVSLVDSRGRCITWTFQGFRMVGGQGGQSFLISVNAWCRPNSVEYSKASPSGFSFTSERALEEVTAVLAATHGPLPSSVGSMTSDFVAPSPKWEEETPEEYLERVIRQVEISCMTEELKGFPMKSAFRTMRLRVALGNVGRSYKTKRRYENFRVGARACITPRGQDCSGCEVKPDWRVQSVPPPGDTEHRVVSREWTPNGESPDGYYYRRIPYGVFRKQPPLYSQGIAEFSSFGVPPAEDPPGESQGPKAVSIPGKPVGPPDTKTPKVPNTPDPFFDSLPPGHSTGPGGLLASDKLSVSGGRRIKNQYGGYQRRGMIVSGPMWGNRRRGGRFVYGGKR